MVELPEGGLRPVFDEHGKPIWAKHGLPWPDHEIKVFVVDQPALFDPEKNGGVPQEISPTTLVMLEADPRIAVKVIGDGGNDVADELVHAKALIAELEEKLKSAQRDLADTAERESAKRVASANLAEEQGKQIAALANELAQARAQLSAGHRKGR
jgi:hypothetical protein